MTFLSLFSGIGGMDLGLERAGMKCVAQVEIDPFCRRVLAKHWPDVPRFDDVRTVTHETFAGIHIDCIAGGFPCQDISNAGKRAGITGERSGLWSEFYRLICEIRPRFALVENVSALLERGIGRVLGDLAEGGYGAEWNSQKTSWLGAPHHRERLFVLAHRDQDSDFNTIRAGAYWERSQDFAWWRGRLDELGAGDGIERRDSYADIMREVDGIPHWVDRVGGCGNAVVPQVAEWIGRHIVAVDAIAREAGTHV